MRTPGHDAGAGGEPALAISLVGLLLAFPSAARWQGLCRSPERAERPNPLVR